MRVKLAVELGCSVGRIVGELARGADHVVGVDLQFGALRRARRLLAGESVAYARRVAGRHYHAATANAGDLVAAATLVCGDALAPPLIPGAYGRVVAINLLDVVRQPRQLLSVIDGLCAHGGEIILTSPFAWQSTQVDDDQRIGTDDPAGAPSRDPGDGPRISARATRSRIQAELPWTLRRDSRSAATYCIHYIRARKH